MISDISGNKPAVIYKSLNGLILIQNSLATVTLSQNFKNTSDCSVEADYFLPIDNKFVLVSLKVSFGDGSIIECKVMEKILAKEKYQDELAKGHSPILATSNSQVLKIFLGLIPAGSDLTVSTTYTYPLKTSEDYWKFELPQGFTSDPSIKYEFTLKLFTDSPITDINSNWEFDFDHSENHLIGLFDSNKKGINPNNLELTYKSQSNIEACCLIQQQQDNYALMISFIPYCEDPASIEDYETIGEYIFILDRSGSMMGSRIQLAKKAVSIFIKSLSSKSRFNIISFGSNYEFMFPESVVANLCNVNTSMALLENFQANMGCTVLLDPLERLFSQSVLPGCPRYIFLLTDGDVSSSDTVLNLIMKNNKNCKFYSFGIEGANKVFIQKAAACGNGDYYMIDSTEHICRFVIEALGKCIAPFIHAIKINWDCEFFPSLDSLQNIQYGKIFCVYAVVSQLPENLPVVSCFDSLKNCEVFFKTERFKFIQGEEIFKLWAKEKIGAFCEDTLEVSLKYQVISHKTAYFGVKGNIEEQSSELIPLKLVSGSSNLLGLSFNPALQCYYPSALNYSSGSSDNSPSSPGYSPKSPGYSPKSPGYSPKSPLIHTLSHPKNLKPPFKPDEKDEIEENSSSEDCDHSGIEDIEQNGPSKNKALGFSERLNALKMCSSYKLRYLNLRKSESDSGSGSMSGEELKENNTIGLEHNVSNEATILLDNSKLYLPIILNQMPEGYWEWGQLLSKLNLVARIIPCPNYDHNVSATALALAFLNLFCLATKPEWKLIEKKAIRWLKKILHDYHPLITHYSQLLNP